MKILWERNIKHWKSRGLPCPDFGMAAPWVGFGAWLDRHLSTSMPATLSNSIFTTMLVTSSATLSTYVSTTMSSSSLASASMSTTNTTMSTLEGVKIQTEQPTEEQGDSMSCNCKMQMVKWQYSLVIWDSGKVFPSGFSLFFFSGSYLSTVEKHWLK